MSSLFESEVYIWERKIPFTRISLGEFMRTMIYNDPQPVGDGLLKDVQDEIRNMGSSVTLTLEPRNTATGTWWTLSWVDLDGQRYSVSAQQIQKCLWRATTKHIQIQRRLDRAQNSAAPDFEI